MDTPSPAPGPLVAIVDDDPIVGQTFSRMLTVSGYEVSDNGKLIAMTRMPSPLLEFSDRTEVWLMNADGSNARQLTKNMVPESNASVSPDGSMVLFTSGAGFITTVQPASSAVDRHDG